MRKILLSVFGLVLASASIGQVINTYPYVQDFEGEGTSTACNGYTMLSPGWSNDVTDGNDWVPDINGTGSGSTGPTANGGADFNPGVAGGKYMYTETSGCVNDTRNLMSTWFDFTATPAIAMNFAYHMYGATMGTMAVDYREGLGMPWTNLVAPMTDNQNIWQTLETDITFLAGNDSVQFRWVAATGTSFTSDMALDDVSVYETSFDGEITGVVDNACFGDQIGEMTAVPIYGVAPFTYSWDNGDTTATISNLSAGTYCVTITDSNLDQVVICDSVQDLATSALEIYAHAVNPWVCTDSTGILVIDDLTGGVTNPAPCGIATNACMGASDSTQNATMAAFSSQFAYPAPLGNFNFGTRHQMNYTAAELTSAGMVEGNISGLAFFIDNLASADVNLTDFAISMTCDTDSVLSAFNNSTVQVMPATTVVLTAGWNWFTFADDFYWNGIDNIIVETCFNNVAATQNPIMGMTTTPNVSVVYYAANNGTVCGNSTVTGTSSTRPIITFAGCPAEGPYQYTYSWDFGGNADSSVVNPGVYVLTVEDNAGCVDSVSVSISESAPVNIDDVTICETNPAVFSATPGFDSYSWSNAETTADITITTGGTYYVDAVDSLGCPTSDTAFVTALPAPVLATSAGDEMFGSDGTILLSIYSSAFPFLVDWDNDGTGDNDDQENQYGLAGGTYTVTVTDANGCYTTDSVVVNSQLGLEESKFEMIVYPNPVQDILTIQLMDVDANASVELYNLQGSLVTAPIAINNSTVNVSMAAFADGVYILKVTSNGATQEVRVVKQ